ncbi:MAG: Asp-tRNA(Asn)/Glu-tRNA(Gln) amidotransferase subunit GatA [Pirellula sp.]
MNSYPFFAHEIAPGLAAKVFSSREITRFFLDRIERLEPSIRAFISWDTDRAIEAADRVDQRRISGEKLAVLAGVPIAIKDILCTTDAKTTCGSRILENYYSPYDAHVVARLRNDGLVILGKTNLDEFAMGGSTETGFSGPSHNPWDLTRTCGGSSGGSAASVSAGMAPVAIGTDTGGSIRQPAAFCGVCGLKPTYGRVSRYGLIAYGSSLDQAGPFGHTVEELAWTLQTIAGHDCRDSTCLNVPVDDYAAAINKPCDAPRIGVIREHLDNEGLHPELRSTIEHAIAVYRKMGCKIVDVSMPNTKYSIATYYIIAPSEASSNLSRFDGAHYGFRADATTSATRENKPASPLIDMYCRTRSQGFGPEVRRRIMLGTYTLSEGYYDAYYLKALKVRRLIRQDYDHAFEHVDVVLGPTTPSPPFRLGEKIDDPVQMYLEDLYTVGANLAGIPAISIPIGATQTGLPIGMQLQGPPLSESRLLQIANFYHRETAYKPQLPPSAI